MVTLIVATKEECEMMKEHFPEYSCIYTKIGASNIIRTCYDIPRDTQMINIGYAGSNSLPIGTVCKVKRTFRLKDEAFKFEDYRHGFQLSEEGFDCYTSNSFVTHTDIKEPCLFDMELNYIAAFPFKLLGSIKIVSDSLCETAYNDYVNQQNLPQIEKVRLILEEMVKELRG